jgi:hypothetical protein
MASATPLSLTKEQPSEQDEEKKENEPSTHSSDDLQAEKKEQGPTKSPSDDNIQPDFNQVLEPPPDAPPVTQEPEWVSGFKLFTIMTGITLVCLLMLLDTSIIVTVCIETLSFLCAAKNLSQAIPRITNDFHSLPDVGWYGSAYMLSR